MSAIPDDLFYTETHEWIRLNGDTATIGITDHAQSELSDLVYIELPKIGASFETKAPAAVVESVKTASDIYAPMAGSVTEINEQAKKDPGLVNRDPYGAGWLFKLKVRDTHVAAAGLKKSQDYRGQIER
jgi:glycine cleavage system H protein